MFNLIRDDFDENSDDIKIKGLIEKGSKVEILDYDKLDEDGSVNMYKVKYNDQEGYVYGKYLVNNEALALEYYKDLQRYVNLDKIPFTYIDTNKSEYNTPDKLHDLYHYLNHELKHNISPCAKKVFESLMLKDLYDLLFSVTNKGGKGNWILDDHIWNMEDEFWYDNKIWKD